MTFVDEIQNLARRVKLNSDGFHAFYRSIDDIPIDYQADSILKDYVTYKLAGNIHFQTTRQDLYDSCVECLKQLGFKVEEKLVNRTIQIGGGLFCRRSSITSLVKVHVISEPVGVSNRKDGL
jgi:hypothetical protein